MIIGSDLEWSKDRVSVLGLAYEDGLKASAIFRTDETMAQYLKVLHKADTVVGHNFLDADCRQLEQEGIDVSWVTPKVLDTRLCLHATHGHLAGTGSYDLRSMVLLLGARQGQRFPLDFKHYQEDILGTCAMDAAAAAWCAPTLQRLITQHHLEKVVTTAHEVQPIFTMMQAQGVRLDRTVLESIYHERKARLANHIDQYGLWEERGKKVKKRVPIWRSPKVLDVFEQRFGVRPANLQRSTWIKLCASTTLSREAREFAGVIIELGRGANDAHWLGSASESDEGIDFEKVNQDGFIYPRYDVCGSPDRAVSSGPNVQNFPRPSDDPRPIPIRSAVIPLNPDHTLIGVDFSAVEMVTNAYESKDIDRVNAVLSKRLGHESTAKMINDTFHLSLTRQQGKACNHAMEKGESPWNLACRLFNTERPSRVQTGQCRSIFDRMLQEYPVLSKFRDDLWERSRENPLVVQNSFGRRLMCFSRSKYGEADERYAKHDPSKKYWCSCGACAPRRDRFKYAIAFLGRSCAFDVLLRKMATIWYERRLDEFSLPYIEVHDSLTFSVPKEKATHYLQRAIECFREPVADLSDISLQCEGSTGENWMKCK